MATTTVRAAGLQGSRLYDYLTTTDHKKIGILYEKDNYAKIIFTVVKWN